MSPPAFAGALKLNAYPVIFPNPTLEIWRGGYLGHLKLNEWRRTHPDKADFVRAGNEVWAWSPESSWQAPEGFSKYHIDIRSNAELGKSLLKLTLRSKLQMHRFMFYAGWSDYGLEFTSSDPAKDVKSHLGGQSPIRIRRRYKLQPYEIESPQGTSLVLAVDRNLRYDFSLSVSDLIARGVQVTGLWVNVHDSVPLPKSLQQYAGCLIGQIRDVQDQDVVISGGRDGLRLLATQMCVPEASRQQRKYLITKLMPAQSTSIMQAIEEAQKSENAHPKRLQDGDTIIDWFNGQVLEPVPGFIVKFGPPVDPSTQCGTLALDKISSPELCISRIDQRCTRSSIDIIRHGPYDSGGSLVGRERPARILFVGLQKDIDSLRALRQMFLQGAPGRKIGFAQMFRLSEPEMVELAVIPGRPQTFHKEESEADAFERSIKETLRTNGDWDLVVFLEEERFKALAPRMDPYYRVKKLLIDNLIPVQCIRVETLNDLTGLPYSLNNIFVQSFAKMGGIPWVLKADPRSLRQEIIVGVGSTTIRESRTGPVSRLVAFTTLFKANGDFLLASMTRPCELSEYRERLADAVYSAIDAAVSREGYDITRPLRLIFHLSQRAGRKERDVIEIVLKRFITHPIEYAVLHLNDDHALHVFDSATGPEMGWRRMFPPEGVSVHLNATTRLMTVRGPKDHRIPGQGASKPIMISLMRYSRFRDLDYLTSQVYGLCYMNWRNHGKDGQPITLRYSNLMARFVARMQELGGVPIGAIDGRLANRLWFL